MVEDNRKITYIVLFLFAFFLLVFVLLFTGGDSENKNEKEIPSTLTPPLNGNTLQKLLEDKPPAYWIGPPPRQIQVRLDLSTPPETTALAYLDQAAQNNLENNNLAYSQLFVTRYEEENNINNLIESSRKIFSSSFDVYRIKKDKSQRKFFFVKENKNLIVYFISKNKVRKKSLKTIASVLQKIPKR